MGSNHSCAICSSPFYRRGGAVTCGVPECVAALKLRRREATGRRCGSCNSLLPAGDKRTYCSDECKSTARSVDTINESDGYLYYGGGLLAKTHPIARHGRLWVHRYVAYEKYGDGEQQCHWCNKTIWWDVPEDSPNPMYDRVEADHLDFDRQNNDPNNIVVSCRGCNQGRKKPRIVEHGQGESGRRNCPCPPCREKKKQYNRKYHAARRARTEVSKMVEEHS